MSQRDAALHLRCLLWYFHSTLLAGSTAAQPGKSSTANEHINAKMRWSLEGLRNDTLGNAKGLGAASRTSASTLGEIVAKNNLSTPGQLHAGPLVCLAAMVANA